MADNVFDIVHTDAYGLVSMVARFDTIEFVPSQALAAVPWNPNSVNTRTALIEFRDQMLTILDPSDRGAPGSEIQVQNRVLKAFDVPHFQVNGRITADQVVGVREFGTTNQFQTVESKVMEKLSIAETNFMGTEEYMAITALQGVTATPGGTILDAYAMTGQTKRTAIFTTNTFDISAGNTANGTNPKADSRIKNKCHQIVRQMRTDLRMGAVIPRVSCLATPAFMDKLTESIEVADKFERFRDATSIGEVGAFLREGAFFGVPPFYYGGIWFEEYRGAGIPANSALFFPVLPAGSPSLYDVYYAPADYLETVNTLGRPRYAKTIVDPSGYNKFIEVEAQFNAVYVSRRPLTLYTCDFS